jgi:hypothetical protein
MRSRLELARASRGMVTMREAHAGLMYRATYYAWSARRHDVPLGRDPLDGRAWSMWRDDLAGALHRAQAIASARVCIAQARAMRQRRRAAFRLP